MRHSQQRDFDFVLAERSLGPDAFPMLREADIDISQGNVHSVMLKGLVAGQESQPAKCKQPL